MFDRLKNLYVVSGKLTDAGLSNAVIKGWITEEQRQEKKNQGARLAKLESEPAERWSSMTRTIFNTIVGAGAGAFATGVIYMMAQHIK